jgi:hypothetical protein
MANPGSDQYLPVDNEHRSGSSAGCSRQRLTMLVIESLSFTRRAGSRRLAIVFSSVWRDHVPGSAR